MISSVTGRPAASNASMMTRVPNAVASISARYISVGRVASVRPTMTPDSSWSTSTERLPFIQSSAMSPWPPARLRPRPRLAAAHARVMPAPGRAAAWVAGGATWSANQAKMSPTPLWPAS